MGVGGGGMSVQDGGRVITDTPAVPCVRELPTDQLRPNDYNPNHMTEEEFAEFVEEVRYLGRLPKPIVVRPGAGEAYEIVDGEHGWRAASEVGLVEVSCEVIDADDFEAMRQTYKRNQHGTHDRAALGQMFRRMMDERGISNRQLAEEISVSEGTIRNALIFAEAAGLRNRYAPEKGAAADDYWFQKMTTQQARDYVRLPEGLRDRWLNAGGAPVWNPDTWGMSDQGTEDLDWYLQMLVKTGIAKVFERGSWAESAKKAYELMVWRQNHLRLLGNDIDAYIRPVVELHPKDPTAVQILERLPMRDGKPFLTPEEWANGLRVAWDKSKRVYELLGMFGDIGKLKAGEMGIPTDDLEDPRVALKKLEVEQDAPDFIRGADIPLRDKHFLTKSADSYFNARADINAAHLSDAERLQLKRLVVEYLSKEHQRYAKEVAAYEAYLDGADFEQLVAGAMGRGGIPYPSSVVHVTKAWEQAIRGHYEAVRKAEEDKRKAAVLGDHEKLISTVVAKFSEAAPRVFGQKVDDKPASQVLEERLRAMPRPELVLMAAVLLKTPVSAWLEAVRDEEGGA
jgi:ParB/RepB/Spo0J family partition protein